MRITDKMLNNSIEYLNKLMNAPETAYTKDDAGLKANVGHHYLYGAYGGVNLHRMVNEAGGVTCPLGHVCVPKRELFNKLNAYIAGIELERSK